MWIIVLFIICVSLITIKYSAKGPRLILNRILFNLHFSMFYLAFLVVLIIWPFPILNGRTVKNGVLWTRLLKYVTIFMRVKWEIRNSEVLAKDRGAVIVANHQSTLDIVGMFHIWGYVRKMTVISKKALLYAGPAGIISYFAGMIFIDRSNPKNAYKQLEKAANVISKKVKIWFYAEGTRNFDNTKFLPFKKGAFTLAVATQAPIIPVVYSPYYFIDRKNYIVHNGHAIIQCLEEVPTAGLTMDDVPELIERVRNMMLVSYKKLSDEVTPSKLNSDSHENVVQQ